MVYEKIFLKVYHANLWVNISNSLQGGKIFYPTTRKPIFSCTHISGKDLEGYFPMVPVTNIPNAPLVSWPFLDVQEWRGAKNFFPKDWGKQSPEEEVFKSQSIIFSPFLLVGKL